MVIVLCARNWQKTKEWFCYWQYKLYFHCNFWQQEVNSSCEIFRMNLKLERSLRSYVTELHKKIHLFIKTFRLCSLLRLRTPDSRAQQHILTQHWMPRVKPYERNWIWHWNSLNWLLVLVVVIQAWAYHVIFLSILIRNLMDDHPIYLSNLLLESN